MFCAAALGMAVAGCGGGGEGGSPTPTPTNPTPPPTPPPAPAPSVAFSATTLALTGDTSSPGVEDQSILITVTNRPAGGVWTRVTPTGTAVGSATVEWPSPGNGRLRIEAFPPGSLGAGSYSSSLNVEVCADSACATQVSGSPATITVNYTVTGSALPTTQVYWSESFISGATITSTETRNPRMTLRLSAHNMPPQGLYIARTALTGSVVSSLVFGQPTGSSDVGTAFAEYAVTLRPPAALGSGIFTDSVQFRACFDTACVREVPNSRHTLSVRLLVPATVGTEFSRSEFAPAGGTTDLVWSAARQQFYVTSSQYTSTGGPATVLALDPVTMTATPGPILAGENLRNLTVSDDGTQLYVASRANPVIHRFALPGLTPDLQIPLGAFSAFEPYLAYDMAPVPGQPQSIVASLAHNNSAGGIRVFDNAAPRPDAVAPVQAFEYARWLVPDSTPGSFISQSVGPSQPTINRMEQLTVDAGGIRVSAGQDTASGLIAGLRPSRAGNELVTMEGRILDRSTGAQVGTLPLPNSMVPLAVVADGTRNRAYVWTQADGNDYLISYDVANRQRLAFARLYDTTSIGRTAARMVLWGNDGVALVDGVRVLVFSGPFFTTYRGAPTQ